jgi:fucose permease
VNATLDVVSHGVGYPLGALIAAFVAEQIGVRGAIAVGWAGMALSILFVVFSPVPNLRAASDFVAAEPAIP